MKKITIFLTRYILPAFVFIGTVLSLDAQNAASETNTLKVSVFDVDATPPVGSMLAYDKMINSWDLSLRARGVVLQGLEKPVVLCAVDWIGINNDSYDAFREALGEAAGTTPDRVTIHAVHQHDAPRSDFGAERHLKAANVDPGAYEGSFDRVLMQRLSEAVRNSLEEAQPVTHIGLGEAEVFQVASNRRVMGPDGLVRGTRFTACTIPDLRAEPEGTIDPMVSLISFWNNDKPLAVLSFYASHPQSYYRNGIGNPDFPGVARFFRQLEVPDALHIHFTGAAGNIGAGKYNDGAKENRGILARRLADGMKRAWETTKKQEITASSMKWNTEPVLLPPSERRLNLVKEWRESQNPETLQNILISLSFVERYEQGKKIDITCLKIGEASILGLPGEPFVEFQLFAKALNPGSFVAVAAYAQAAGYIPHAEEVYHQGGYEAGVAGVAPEAADILRDAITKLLQH